MYKINKNKKSFSLIETIVSILILVIGISGAIIVLNNIVSNFRLATDTFVANNLAIEGIELMRNIRDNNLLAGREWNYGLTITPPYHQIDFNDTTLTLHTDGILNIVTYFQHSPGTLAFFSRRIEIINCPDIVDCLEIRSIVSWSDIIGHQNVKIITRLFRGRDI